MRELKVSNELLDDHAALQARVEEDGYLFFRDVLDPEDVAQVRGGIQHWCRGHGLVGDDGAWTGANPDLPLWPIDLHDQGLWQWLAARPATQSVLTRVLGEEAFFLPITEYRIAWPGRELGIGIHQDGVFSKGMEFMVFWVPLVEIDEKAGGILVAAGQHRRGALHPVPGRNDPYAPPEVIPEDAWHRTTYRPGDLLVMDRMTPHTGQPSTGSMLRLSVDFRASAASAPHPIVGPVVAADDSSVTLRSDLDDTEVTLRIDADSVLRSPSARTGPALPTDYVGHQAIALHSDGIVRLLRFARGGRPIKVPAEPSVN